MPLGLVKWGKAHPTQSFGGPSGLMLLMHLGIPDVMMIRLLHSKIIVPLLWVLVLIVTSLRPLTLSQTEAREQLQVNLQDCYILRNDRCQYTERKATFRCDTFEVGIFRGGICIPHLACIGYEQVRTTVSTLDIKEPLQDDHWTSTFPLSKHGIETYSVLHADDPDLSTDCAILISYGTLVVGNDLMYTVLDANLDSILTQPSSLHSMGGTVLLLKRAQFRHHFGETPWTIRCYADHITVRDGRLASILMALYPERLTRELRDEQYPRTRHCLRGMKKMTILQQGNSEYDGGSLMTWLRRFAMCEVLFISE